VRIIGLTDKIASMFKKVDKEDLFQYSIPLDKERRIYLKQLSLQICINFISRTISQSDFRIKHGKDFVKDDLHYLLNVKPNWNDNASTFWQRVIYKLIYDNECLIIHTDEDYFLVADHFERVEYAVKEDLFRHVSVKGIDLKRTFPRGQVIYLQYNNQDLSPLIDGLYRDYGELLGYTMTAQLRKAQIRGVVDLETINLKDDKNRELLQDYIDKLYNAFSKRLVALVPQQKGMSLEEQGKSFQGQSVEEIDKVTDGFLSKVAMSLGIPLSLIKGDMADVEKQTRNYMTFCIDPLLKKITDELNRQLFDKNEYLNGWRVDIRRASYSNMFDVATSADKLRAAGIATGNELKDELGLERVDDPMLDKFVLTKNYQEDNSQLEGGENE